MKILNFKNFLFINEEIDFNLIPCSYTYSIINNGIVDINTFTFITKKGNSYSVYINNTYEPNYSLKDKIGKYDGTYLYNYSNGYYIPTIYFSLTSNGLNQSLFNKLTNFSETFEVMGKVCFIINQYINNNPKYKVYSIGGVDVGKMRFYLNWLSKLNISEYKIGVSSTYRDNFENPTESYYLIV
jgi:hypothetical protein